MSMKGKKKHFFLNSYHVKMLDVYTPIAQTFFDKSCILMHVHLLHKCIFKCLATLRVHLSNVFNLLLHKAALFNNQSHHAKQSQSNIKESNIK